MNKSVFTYKKSGVDINAAEKFVKFIAAISSRKKGKKKFNNIGGFGSISNIPNNIKDPKIVACTDGVGTKIEIANTIKKFDTIGIDLVAMSVNDLIVQGARPLLFLDYISINKINLPKLKSIIRGVVKGCKISECSLVGGETAEMPGTYEKGKFDIAGFAVGVVDKKKILNKKKIKKNDLILAVPSIEGTAKIRSFFLIFFLFKIFFLSTTPTAKPAISNLPFSYVPGISAVSPPTRLHSEILHPFTTPLIIDFNFGKFILLIDI